jgi:hypothetical protein
LKKTKKNSYLTWNKIPKYMENPNKILKGAKKDDLFKRIRRNV